MSVKWWSAGGNQTPHRSFFCGVWRRCSTNERGEITSKLWHACTWDRRLPCRRLTCSGGWHKPQLRWGRVTTRSPESRHKSNTKNPMGLLVRWKLVTNIFWPYMSIRVYMLQRAQVSSTSRPGAGLGMWMRTGWMGASRPSSTTNWTAGDEIGYWGSNRNCRMYFSFCSPKYHALISPFNLKGAERRKGWQGETCLIQRLSHDLDTEPPCGEVISFNELNSYGGVPQWLGKKCRER